MRFPVSLRTKAVRYIPRWPTAKRGGSSVETPFDWPISISQQVVPIERILKAHAQPQGRCEVLLRGVDLTTFFPSQVRGAKPPVVLFVGRITEAKGVFDLLVAWARVVARCPNAELWVVGPDHTNGRFSREARSGRYGCSIRVNPPVPLPDVAELMRQAQVFCLPSHGEGTPNSVMEALACWPPCRRNNGRRDSGYCRVQPDRHTSASRVTFRV